MTPAMGPKKYPAKAMGTASMENRLMADGITVVNRAKTTLSAHSSAQVATTRVAIRPPRGCICLVVACLDIKKSSFQIGGG